MAREYAPIRVDIMGDDDFRDLTPPAQHLYFLLLIDAKLSYCGVTDWRPRRIATRAKDWTPEQVEAACIELAHGMFIIVDEETEEVLIRSFIKHDGLMKQPKMALAMLTALAGVESKALRGVIVHELVKLHRNFPNLTAWASATSRDRLADVLRRPAVDPSTYPTGYPPNPPASTTQNPTENPIGNPFSNPSPKPFSPIPLPTPTPTTYKKTPSTPAAVEAVDPEGFEYPTTIDALPLAIAEPVESPTAAKGEPAGFAEWYALYPRKVGRQDAARAYAKARKTVTEAQLLLAVRRFASDPNLPPPEEKRFIPHPATWLKDGRWTDEPLPARNAQAVRPSGSRPQTRNAQNMDYMSRRLAAMGSPVDAPAPASPPSAPYRNQIGA